MSFEACDFGIDPAQIRAATARSCEIFAPNIFALECFQCVTLCKTRQKSNISQLPRERIVSLVLRKPTADSHFFSFARVFSTIGVPLNPKRLRIWFIRYRSCEKCSAPPRSVKSTNVGGRTEAWVI